jgi:hypothetical protein
LVEVTPLGPTAHFEIQPALWGRIDPHNGSGWKLALIGIGGIGFRDLGDIEVPFLATRFGLRVAEIPKYAKLNVRGFL